MIEVRNQSDLKRLTGDELLSFAQEQKNLEAARACAIDEIKRRAEGSFDKLPSGAVDVCSSYMGDRAQGMNLRLASAGLLIATTEGEMQREAEGRSSETAIASTDSIMAQLKRLLSDEGESQEFIRCVALDCSDRRNILPLVTEILKSNPDKMVQDVISGRGFPMLD